MKAFSNNWLTVEDPDLFQRRCLKVLHNGFQSFVLSRPFSILNWSFYLGLESQGKIKTEVVYSSVLDEAFDGKQKEDTASASILSTDESDRMSAVENLKAEILKAISLKATTFVIDHLETEPSEIYESLFASAKAGAVGESHYQKKRDELEAYREETRNECFEALLESLGELEGFIKEQPIQVAIVSPKRYLDLPSVDEFKEIFRLFKKDLSYWHDTGRIYIAERMGFYRLRWVLEKLKKHLVGIQLHDVLSFQSEKALFTGAVDLIELESYFKKNCILSFDFHPDEADEKLFSGVHRLLSIYERSFK